ncbi:tryptophan halogenase family protein [Thalassotalea profundi]|uniref:Tryptophan halogenase n=1 Tax=Thalassotalea profundi TaxID=2036687 RepID=A0ABQ3IKZ8_9GAMM|nr:tryptophan halogenase family protein [Thalassotalea profundi]GHE86930.1 tryptophan halogenase [Thalassotalea profundi]
MSEEIKNIVILGGGSAGWLTAGTLAAKHRQTSKKPYAITLIESPEVKIIGVGEGTWPTMRGTLKTMGINESAFIRECDVSFKQGAKFVKWITGAEDDFYYHPLELPNGYFDTNMAQSWCNGARESSFSSTVSAQEALCEAAIAPKMITSPEYAAIANYAYHIDAGKFAQFLKRHCIENLGVNYISDHVTHVNSDEKTGDITALTTKQNGDVEGDLFVDCSGAKSLLIGQHYQVPLTSKKDVLFIDNAIAVQAPYATPDVEIPPYTLSTAQKSGWIWDIGLPTRRGIGHVFSSQHCSVEEAKQTLIQYLEETGVSKIDELRFNHIDFNPGIREQFWVNNCVAVGMSAGFLEPLEASALVMVELAAAAISEQLPASKMAMPILAKQFNEKFHYNWDRIVDFLKLHYLASQRTDSQFWRDNQQESSIPDSLKALMILWQHRTPSEFDFKQKREVFSAASYQYVLYGMQQLPQTLHSTLSAKEKQLAKQCMDDTKRQTAQYTQALPTHRALLKTLQNHSFQAI